MPKKWVSFRIVYICFELFFWARKLAFAWDSNVQCTLIPQIHSQFITSCHPEAVHPRQLLTCDTLQSLTPFSDQQCNKPLAATDGGDERNFCLVTQGLSIGKQHPNSQQTMKSACAELASILGKQLSKQKECPLGLVVIEGTHGTRLLSKPSAVLMAQGDCPKMSKPLKGWVSDRFCFIVDHLLAKGRAVFTESFLSLNKKTLFLT